MRGFKRAVVSRILLVDGALMIVVAFFHLLSTPLIQTWLSRELNATTLSTVSPAYLLNHLLVGILLIPFGISTLYGAGGVRVGQPWARVIAMTNAIAVLVLPIVVALVMGPLYFNSPIFVIAGGAIVVIGISMFIPLLWIES